MLGRVQFCLFFGFFLVFNFISCGYEAPTGLDNLLTKPAYQFSSEVATDWNKTLIELDRTTPLTCSPFTARSISYINLAAYEAIVPGMTDRYKSIAQLHFNLNMPSPESEKSYFWPIVMNAAFKSAATKFYARSSKLYLVDSIFNEIVDRYKSQLDINTINRSVDFGLKFGEVVYAWSASDVYGHNVLDQLYSIPYGTIPAPGIWAPTPPDYTKAFLVNWGSNVRMFLAQNSDFEISAPPTFSNLPSSSYVANCIELIGNVEDVKVGASNKKEIAEYWSANCDSRNYTTAAHWLSITSQMIEKNSFDLAYCAEILVKVCFTMHDAEVGCYRNKYKYNLLRPVDYIRAYMDIPDWTPATCLGKLSNGQTPPTPSYPSEDATVAYAAAYLLGSTIGIQSEVDSTYFNRNDINGKPRTYGNVIEIANECAMARTFVGTNYAFDLSAGRTLGYNVGKRIFGLNFKN